jgi:hypothetical protein
MSTNSNVFVIKRNDTLPSLQLTLIDKGCLGGKEPYSLSGVTGITFTMVNNCGEYKIFAKQAEIVSYSAGTIQYNWEEGDTNESGDFLGEFQLIYSDGKKMSIPQNGQIRISIPKDLNPYG